MSSQTTLKLAPQAELRLTAKERTTFNKLALFVDNEQQNEFINYCKRNLSSREKFYDFFNQFPTSDFVLESDNPAPVIFFRFLSETRAALFNDRDKFFKFVKPTYSEASLRFKGFNKLVYDKVYP